MRIQFLYRIPSPLPFFSISLPISFRGLLLVILFQLLLQLLLQLLIQLLLQLLFQLLIHPLLQLLLQLLIQLLLLLSPASTSSSTSASILVMGQFISRAMPFRHTSSTTRAENFLDTQLAICKTKIKHLSVHDKYPWPRNLPFTFLPPSCLFPRQRIKHLVPSSNINIINN